jgi:hypothetical protein
MRRFCIVVGILVALVAVEAVPVLASTAPTVTASAIKPAYEKKAAPGRATEWANYYWDGLEDGTAYSYGACEGPFENGHGVTQWACYGGFTGDSGLKWQVNIDAYGEPTYHHLSNI